MPKKSPGSFSNKHERPPRKAIKKIDSDTKHTYYKSIDDITKRISNNITLKLSDPKFTIPKISVAIDDSLAYTIECYGSRLREDHEIYKCNKHNLQNVTIKPDLCDKFL